MLLFSLLMKGKFIMNKILLYILSAILLINSSSISLADSDQTTFAVVIPLSGKIAEAGEWIKRGLEMAKEELEEQGKSAPNLIFEDSQAEPSKAISAYRKLKSTSNFPVVFTFGSGVALALSPIVNKDKIIQMGVATSTEDYTSPNDYTFRNFARASQEAKYMAKLTLDHFKAKKVAIVHSQNDYGTSTADYFEKAYKKIGGEVLLKTDLEPGVTDTKVQVLFARKAKPDLIFLAAYPVEGYAFVKQAEQLGLKKPIIASAALFGSDKSMSSLGSAGEGMTFAAAMPVINPNSKFAKKFEILFDEKFGPQHFFVARAYDAFLATASALEMCPKENRDATCLKEKLVSMPKFQGIGGEVDFDENGDVNPVFSAYQIKSGTYASLNG